MVTGPGPTRVSQVALLGVCELAPDMHANNKTLACPLVG